MTAAVFDFHLEQAEQAARFLRSIGNPHRLKLVCLLVGTESTVGDLITHFDISPSALSQHLAVLRKEEILDCRKQAQTVFYFIKDPDTEVLLKLLKAKFCPDL